MKLEILQVPGCPNVGLLERRIAEAVAGEQIDVAITHRVLNDQAAATEARMTGSPTLLVDGEDPLTEPGSVAGVSCRLYPVEAAASTDGAPSVAALRAALNLAARNASIEVPAGGPADCCVPAAGDISCAEQASRRPCRQAPLRPNSVRVYS